MNKKKIILLTPLLTFVIIMHPAAIEDVTQTELNETLIRAAYNGNNTVLEQLINLKADANYARTQDGVTPLLLAAQNGHILIVEYLIKNGVIVDLAKKNYETTPLNIAAYCGHTAVVKCLIAARANIYKPDFNGIIPIHKAARQKHANIVSLLIDAHRSQQIAPLCAAVKAVHAIEQAQACATQKQPAKTQHAACYALDADEKSEMAGLPSIIEKLPIEYLHTIMQNISSASLAYFRQASKKCRVAAQYEYIRRLKNRIDMEQKQFETLLTTSLKRAKKHQNNGVIINLLKQAPCSLWQAALDTQPNSVICERLPQPACPASNIPAATTNAPALSIFSASPFYL